MTPATSAAVARTALTAGLRPLGATVAAAMAMPPVCLRSDRRRHPRLDSSVDAEYSTTPAGPSSVAIYYPAVDIEERLLHFSPKSALHAWRLFRVRAEGERLVLSSPMYHDDTTGLTPLWPYVEAEGTCYLGHSAPFPGCRCGIYGAVAGTLDSLPGYLCDTAYERHPWAYAQIACYGRVFVDMRGVRTERAKLLRIALSASAWPGEAWVDEASRMLRDRYGVPVGGAGLVPDWVTANLRPGGRPPGGESLNLDLARMDLSCREDRS